MSDIKELIRQEIERRKKRWMYDDLPIAIGRYYEDRDLLAFIDSLPEDASCVYDTNKLTPTPSVNIEDVARVQFASHVKVFDRKRKAVFDWEQFKEVAGIFYGFGKKNSLPEEKPSEDLEEAAKEYATTHIRNNEFPTADSAFIAGAEWQKAKYDEETADLMTIVALDAGQRAIESHQLTWQDVNKILDISGEMLEEMLEDGDGDFIGMEEAWAKEVLKRFKILKEK